jgi:uncharacterized protein (TIGR02217 family)
MSTSVFPTLKGLGWDVVRTPIWSNNVNEAVSGFETAIAFWTYPRWKWQLTFNFLRSDATNHEFQDLLGFFNLRQGNFDTFLYQDADDNSVTGQGLGSGDGSTLTFPLVAAYGSFAQPIRAPHTVSKVYVDGVDKAGHWTVSNWGTATPGIITFDSAPGNGLAVTADFTYYFPCRFTDPQIDFSKFMSGVYKSDGISFKSLK